MDQRAQLRTKYSEDQESLESIFYRIILPQLYIFLGLIVISAFRTESDLSWVKWFPALDARLLIMYCSGALLPFAFYFFAHLVVGNISPWLLSLELLILSGGLFVLMSLMSISDPASLFVPITLLSLTIVMYVKEPKRVIRCIFPTAILLLGISLWNFASAQQPSLSIKFFQGILVYFIALGSALFGILVVDKFAGMTSRERPTLEIHDTESFSTTINQFLKSELSLRFIPVSVVVSFGTLIFALLSQNSVNYYAIWLSLVALQVLIFNQAKRESDIATVYLFWCIEVCILVTLWWHTLLANVAAPQTVEVGLLLVALGLGGLPWSGRFNMLFGAITVVITGFLIPNSSSPILMAALMVALTISLLRLNARTYILAISKATLTLLLSKMRVCKTTGDLSEVLADMAYRLIDSSGCIILRNDSQAFYRGSGSLSFSNEERPLLAGLYQAVDILGAGVGVIKSATLDRQLVSAVYDWFGYIPKNLVYFKTEFKQGVSTEVIIGVLPAGTTASLVDREFLENSLRGLIATAEQGVDRGKKSGRGTHIFISPVRDMLGVGEDVSEIIHSVNNSAQEISRVIESLSSRLLALQKSLDAEPEVDGRLNVKSDLGLCKQMVDYLDCGIRNIATSVSDTKWIREATYATRPESPELVSVGDVFNEFQQFLAYRMSRGESVLTQRSHCDDSAQICVANREFLETCLRGVGRILTRTKNMDLHLSYSVESDKVLLEFELPGRGFKNIENIFQARKDEEVFKALQNVIFISDAEMKLIAAEDLNKTARLIFSFKRNNEAQPVVSSNLGWALLVDDKPEIVDFYSSVAQALSLPHGVAHNLAEARDLLRQRGEPGIVVTDIQLDQENGLELVRELRESYGAGIPIIVVSGNIEDNLRAQVFTAGASRYLTKPVSRKKLFMEIKELIYE